MSRKQIDNCIICGMLPCQCSKPAKTRLPAVKRVTAPSSSAQPDRAKLTPEPERPLVVTAEECEWREVIRMLAPILSQGDLNRYHRYLHPGLHPEVRRRLLEWRQRNERG